MDDLAAIGTLLAVARERSFSGAALELGYTQPAVSKQIAALERRYGAPLVDRGTRPLRLTEAGATLASHGEAALARIRAAQIEIDALMRAETGHLRLGTFSSAAATFVPPAIAAFADTHSGVTVTLREADPQTQIELARAGEIDLAVVYDYPGHAELTADDLEFWHLVDDPDDVVVARDHPLVRRRRITIADLARERWIFPTLGHDHPVTQILSAACSEAGFDPEIAFRINDCQGAQALVAGRLGIALLPRLAIHPLHHRVVTRPLSGSTITRRVRAARLKAAHLTPAATAFLSLLRQEAAAFA